MAALQITCVTTRDNTHEGIILLGGYGWSKFRQEVINDIKMRLNSYYTEVNGKKAEVGVNRGVHGEYLQTHADGYWNNNLLALNACPV